MAADLITADVQDWIMDGLLVGIKSIYTPGADTNTPITDNTRKYYAKRGVIDWEQYQWDRKPYAACIIDTDFSMEDRAIGEDFYEVQMVSKIPYDQDSDSDEKVVHQIRKDCRYLLKFLRDRTRDGLPITVNISDARASKLYDPELEVQGYSLRFKVSYTLNAWRR